jgi:hypothetical protein
MPISAINWPISSAGAHWLRGERGGIESMRRKGRRPTDTPDLPGAIRHPLYRHGHGSSAAASPIHAKIVPGAP